jgi:transcriptional regulator with XRE-family HTH domain
MKTDFASILMNLRHENNLSQKKAADELGISQALLSHYENGVREPRLEFIVKACAYYGVSTDYMLGRTDEKSFDGKITLNCSDDDQRRNADAASLIIALLSEAGDAQLSSSAAKYISLSIFNVLAALCSPVKPYEPLFDAALKTAESVFMRDVRRVKENPDIDLKLSEKVIRNMNPMLFAAYDELREIVRIAMASMAF